MQKITKGQKFGNWQLKKFLGEGGNGFVWLALNAQEDKAAIKILAKLETANKEKTYARFKNEVYVMQANSDIEGLLPIIEAYLPDEIDNETPWYVMPIAITLDAYLTGKSFEVAVQAVLAIGELLIKLHEREISHRDIKPANILVKDDKFYLADFGLVDYPNKDDLTGTGEQVGAKWTIAPEMKREGHKANGKSADVYSLSKTLWILLSGHRFGFEGQYDPDSVNGLSKLNLHLPSEEGLLYTDHSSLYTRPLDDLLKASTNDDPLMRPSISEFVEKLRSWIDTYKNFRKRNPLQWYDVQARLFPMAIPQRAIWEATESILEVLNYLSSASNLNHMLLPGSGGVDMLGAKQGSEADTIELNVGERSVYVVRPKRLIFENFGFDWEWNYFRLETGALELSESGSARSNHEWLREIAPHEYVSEREWQIDREMEREYPSDARIICRYFDGDFLILQKTSTYNRISSTYDGRHNQMNTDEFRAYMAGKVELAQRIRHDERFIRMAEMADCTIDEYVLAVFRSIFHKEYLQKFSQNH
jgi:serine/threonine protein kinase